MKNKNGKIDWLTLIFGIVVIFIIVFLISLPFLEKTYYDIACKDSGFESHLRSGEVNYCIDSQGYSHEVSFENIGIWRMKAIEIKQEMSK